MFYALILVLGTYLVVLHHIHSYEKGTHAQPEVVSNVDFNSDLPEQSPIVVDRSPCPVHNHANALLPWRNHTHRYRPAKNGNVDAVVLLLVETDVSKFAAELKEILDAMRIRHSISQASSRLPPLATGNRGQFAVIVFESMYRYVNMDTWQKQVLDGYARAFDVGIIAFIASRPDKSYRWAKVNTLPLHVSDNVEIDSLEMNPWSSFYHVTKAATIPNVTLSDSVVFHPKHGGLESILGARIVPNAAKLPEVPPQPPDPRLVASLMVVDHGHHDGVFRVLIANQLQPWQSRLLFMDALVRASKNRLDVNLVRHIQVDVDDVFVGKTGTRMQKQDVQVRFACFVDVDRSVPLHLHAMPRRNTRIEGGGGVSVSSAEDFSRYQTYLYIITIFLFHSCARVLDDWDYFSRNIFIEDHASARFVLYI